MSHFFHKHRPHLILFVLCAAIAVVSGVIFLNEPKNVFTEQTHATAVPDSQVPPTITTTIEALITRTPTPPVTPTSTPKAPTSTEILITSKLIIQGSAYTVAISENISVYDVMRHAQEQINGFSFMGKNYGGGLGFFVEEINGVKNDPREHLYWIYSVNGKKAMIGISNYIIHSGDTISWAYETEQL